MAAAEARQNFKMTDSTNPEKSKLRKDFLLISQKLLEKQSSTVEDYRGALWYYDKPIKYLIERRGIDVDHRTKSKLPKESAPKPIDGRPIAWEAVDIVTKCKSPAVICILLNILASGRLGILLKNLAFYTKLPEKEILRICRRQRFFGVLRREGEHGGDLVKLSRGFYGFKDIRNDIKAINEAAKLEKARTLKALKAVSDGKQPAAPLEGKEPIAAPLKVPKIRKSDLDILIKYLEASGRSYQSAARIAQNTANNPDNPAYLRELEKARKWAANGYKMPEQVAAVAPIEEPKAETMREPETAAAPVVKILDIKTGQFIPFNGFSNEWPRGDLKALIPYLPKEPRPDGWREDRPLAELWGDFFNLAKYPGIMAKAIYKPDFKELIIDGGKPVHVRPYDLLTGNWQPETAKSKQEKPKEKTTDQIEVLDADGLPVFPVVDWTDKKCLTDMVSTAALFAESEPEICGAMIKQIMSAAYWPMSQQKRGF